MAQEAASEEEDEIVVTGVRAAIQSSIEQKREASVVADVLASEDIGDIPALTVGEAIENITGASTHREKGGASEIAVRGLGPYLGATTFNGRETTNGSGDRSVNFNMFPSELINGIAVYKSQQADFVEGGVAGIIDMQTMFPLDFSGRRIQLEGRGIYQGYDDRLVDDNGLGWRGTASYVDQFDLPGGAELGISLGYQEGESNNPEEMFTSSSTWVACNGAPAVPPTATQNCSPVTPASYASGATPPGTPFYLTTGSRTFVQFDETDERNSLFGAIQFRIPNQIQISFDYQNSIYEFTEQRQQLNLSETMRGYGTSPVFTDEGVLLSYSGNTTLESTPLHRFQTEQYEGGGLNIELYPTDRLTLSVDYGWSDTYRSRMDREVRLRSNSTDVFGVAVPGVINGQRVAYTFDATVGDIPQILINPLYDVNDADNFSAAGRLRRTDEITATRIDAVYELGQSGITALHAGVRFAEHEFRDVPQDRTEISFSNAITSAANLACRLPQFPQTDFLSDASGQPITSWATFDTLCLFNELIGTEDLGRTADLRAIGNRDVTETTTAFYVMADYATEIANMPLTGNFGVRHVNTEVESIGLRDAFNVIDNGDGTIRLEESGNFDTLVFESENNVWLPSFNAALEATDKLLVRLALFRAMSRPDPEDLGAGRTISIDTSDVVNVEDAINSITAAGNPAMEPLLSWNADLSFEYYLNEDSLFSAAVYYKLFQGGFENTVVDEQYTIGGETFTVPVVVQRTSDEESEIFGVELGASHRLSYLPHPFDGLGFRLGYNYANSTFETDDLRLGDQVDPATGVVTPGIIAPVNIFGLSEHVFSGSVYYEIGPLELQAIYKYRSAYYQQFVGAAAQNRVVRDGTVVDFRARYNITDNWSVSLEGSNITNEPRVEDMPIPGSVREVHVYGPRYYLGTRIRF
jgi:TonB-dependent receptor